MNHTAMKAGYFMMGCVTAAIFVTGSVISSYEKMRKELKPLTFEEKRIDLDGNGIEELVSNEKEIFFGFKSKNGINYFDSKSLDYEGKSPRVVTIIQNGNITHLKKRIAESILGKKVTYGLLEQKFLLQKFNYARKNHKK